MLLKIRQFLEGHINIIRKLLNIKSVIIFQQILC